MTSIALTPAHIGSRAFLAMMKAATRHVRWTVFISILLIFGSFISAAVIQMRRDRAHALEQAAFMETRRAQTIASDVGGALDRYAAIGGAFANALTNVETSAALSEAGGAALQNVAVLDPAGRLLFEMRRKPKDLLPLRRDLLAAARASRTVFSADAGRSVVLTLPQDGRIVLVQLAARNLIQPAGMEDDLFATRDGRVLAIGRNWHELPASEWIALSNLSPETRQLELPSGRRLLALSPVRRWPVVVGASVEVGDALSAWYGTLPLYFFFILGPAFAGAGLAVVFVREFERRTRPTSADRLLKAKRNAEAKLLIRLADAERRAVEAQRSKSEFITHMSHELRTPLNAIIGFSEMIEQELFGKPGHPKYEEYARDIHGAGQKLHARINEILEFANLETGKQPIALAPVETSVLLRHAVEEAAGRAFSRKIRLSLSLPDSAKAIADEQALHRALNNLVANAVQCTRDGGLVRAQVRDDDTDIAISVQDNAFGFSTNEAVRAGEPFANSDRSGSDSSAGLGIAIAGSLIRRMGGALIISGAQGEGAVAEIRLRRA